MSRKDYNSINWSEHFYLDETSPSGLRWNRDVYFSTSKTYIRYHKGDAAGNIHYNYKKIPCAWKVKVCGVTYFVHRIITILLHGSFDNNLDIDHLDGNPLNNSFGNLRLADMVTNMRNCRLQQNNKTGVNGVNYRTTKTSPAGLYVAHWRTLERSGKNKSFSIAKYGDSGAFRLACEYRTAQIALLNENGANYTLRHGSA